MRVATAERICPHAADVELSTVLSATGDAGVPTCVGSDPDPQLAVNVTAMRAAPANSSLRIETPVWQKSRSLTDPAAGRPRIAV